MKHRSVVPWSLGSKKRTVTRISPEDGCQRLAAEDLPTVVKLAGPLNVWDLTEIVHCGKTLPWGTEHSHTFHTHI